MAFGGAPSSSKAFLLTEERKKRGERKRWKRWGRDNTYIYTLHTHTPFTFSFLSK